MSGTTTGDVMEAAPEKARQGDGSDKTAGRAGSGKTKAATASKKAAADSRKADTAKKRAAKKRATGRKRTAAKSPSGKKSTHGSGTLDSSDPRKSAGRPDTSLERAAVEEVLPGPADETATPPTAPNGNPEVTQPPDPKSLSWMAAQAVSALNAVKASQAEKLQVMLAAAETPEVAQHESEKPQQESRPVGSTDAVTKPVEEAGEHQPTALTEQVIAARAAAGHRLPLRPVLLFALIAIAGWLGYRYWLSEREIGKVAEVPEAAVIESLQQQNITDMAVPQNPAITVVADEPVVNPAPEMATTTTGQAPAVSPDPVSPPVVMTPPASEAMTAVNPVTETVPHTAEQPAAVTRETVSPPVVMTPPAPDAAAAGEQPDAVAERQVTELGVVDASTEPAREADTAAIAPSSPSPAVTGEATRPTSRGGTQPSQPRYRNPGYGYYPQQPSWQQRYPNPGYSQYPRR